MFYKEEMPSQVGNWWHGQKETWNSGLHIFELLLWGKKKKNYFSICILDMLALMALSDARPTGDREVAGSMPIGPSNILSWRLIMEYFLRSFSPFC